MRTMGKIPMYIKYIEKENAIEVLEQTKKRNAKYYHSLKVECA